MNNGSTGPACWARMVLAVTIILIMVVVVTITRPRICDCEDFLTGFWVADPGFLQEAELDDMYLYLEPSSSGGAGRGAGILTTRRQGYLVMTNKQGEFVSNQGLAVTYGPSLQRWWDATRANFSQRHPYVIPRAQFEFDDEDFLGAMPERMTMSLSRADGSLVLHDDEKVYASFWKDAHVSSAVAGSGR